MFKDNENKEILKSIDKRLRNIETMEKNKRFKKAIKKDEFFEVDKDSSTWLWILIMLAMFNFKNRFNEDKKEEDKE